MPQGIRVMLVDDSAIVRGLMDRALRADSAFDIVGSAGNGEAAISALRRTPTDVMILDIEMPVMDGLTALPQLLKISPGTRIIISSTMSTRNAEISLKAMQLGAVDYIPKPSSKDPNELTAFYAELSTKIKALAPASYRAGRVETPPRAPVETAAAAAARSLPILPIQAPAIPVRQNTQPAPAGALAIASSTGGPQALLTIFRELKNAKIRVPIFITQHMPPNFTTILADHITKASGMDCHEAIEGEEVKPGVIYLAPGDYHMTIRRDATTSRMALDRNPPENFCRPSADPMLRSLVKVYGKALLVLVLTGIGADGARGASEAVNAGGSVVAQDEATSVVYGMPRAVAEAKLTSAVLPLPAIAPYILKAVT